MVFSYRLPALLLVLSLARVFAFPRGQHNKIRSVNEALEVVFADTATLNDLAENLQINATCLAEANPSKVNSTLQAGDYAIVPQTCCDTSCDGDFCSQRSECDGHTVDDDAAQQPGAAQQTSVYSTVTSNVPENACYGSGGVVQECPQTPASTSVNSQGHTVLAESGVTITLPLGIETITTIRTDGVTFTFTPATTTTSTTPAAALLPVTTSVAGPTASGQDSQVPCHVWFFDICIDWGHLSVGGWGFNFPTGVHPPGPPPSITFPSGIQFNIEGSLPPWPAITVGPDHVPTYSPEPSDCETESAEICLTSTSYGVSSTYTTTQQVVSTCATIFGCAAEGSDTGTTTTETKATGTCFSFEYGSGYSWDSYPTGGDKEDDVAARKVRRSAVPTATTFIKTIVVAGAPTDAPAPTALPSKVLHKRLMTDTRTSKAFGTCTLATSVTLSAYPDVSDYPQYPAASSYFPISRTRTMEGRCIAAYIFSTNDLAGVSAQIGGPTYQTVSAPTPTPRVNSDHVYEVNILGRFFAYALALPGAPTCSEFNQYYVSTGLVQDLFDKLPNVNYPDFAAMDWYVNVVKGNYFAHPPPSVASTKYSNALQYLQQYGLVAQYMDLDPITALFRTTHQRLYDHLVRWDNGYEGCMEPGVSPTWAASYSDYMTSFLSARGSTYSSAASSWYDIINSGAAQGSNVPVYNQLQRTYPVESFTLPVSGMAEGLTAPQAAKVKRQATCTYNSHARTSSNPATTNYVGTCQLGEQEGSPYGQCAYPYPDGTTTVLEAFNCPSSAACPSASAPCYQDISGTSTVSGCGASGP